MAMVMAVGFKHEGIESVNSSSLRRPPDDCDELHDRSCEIPDAVSAPPPPPPPRKAITIVREISSRYLSPTAPPPRRTSSAYYVSSFSSVARRLPSPPRDRTPQQYRIPGYALPSSSRRGSSSDRRLSPTPASSSVTPSPEVFAPSSRRSDQIFLSATSQSEPWSPSHQNRPAKTRLGGHSLNYNQSSKSSMQSTQRAVSSPQVVTDRTLLSTCRLSGFDQTENSGPIDNLHRKQAYSSQYCFPNASRLYGSALSKSVDVSADREGESGSQITSIAVQSRALTPLSRVLRPATSNFGSLSQSININGSSSSLLPISEHQLNDSRSKETPIRSRKGPVIGPDDAKCKESVHELDDKNAQLVYLNTTSGVCGSRHYMDGITLKTKQRARTPTRLMHDNVSRLRNSSDQSLFKPGQPLFPLPLSGTPQRVHQAISRPLSPVKSHASPFAKGCLSPRNSTFPLVSNHSRSRPTGMVLSSSPLDLRKGKKGLTNGDAAFLHRILYNRYLQWRFVNARAELISNTQRLTGEKLLYSVWVKTTELQAALTTKRLKLQQVHQAYKVSSVLKSQGVKLQEWSQIHIDHRNALCGTVQAFEAAMLRLPVEDGVKADTWALKEVIASAVDLIHAVEYSANILWPRISKANKLVSELVSLAGHERELMEECGYLLLCASSFKVEECSLRMHIMQSMRERARVLGHLMESSFMQI